MEKITSFKHNCIIIRVRRESIDLRGSLYEAVRRCWRANIHRAQKAVYVLAIIGTPSEMNLEVQVIYKPDRRYYPTDEGLCKKKEKECLKAYKTDTSFCLELLRIAFHGMEISKDTNYLHKLIPKTYFPLRNPVRFTYK